MFVMVLPDTSSKIPNAPAHVKNLFRHNWKLFSYNFSSGGGGGGRVINIPNYALLAIILAYYGKGAQKF